MDYTARLNLPLIHTSQAQKEITHNEALIILDVLTHPVVQSVGALLAPDNALNGHLYVIGQNPEGIFAAYANKIALRLDDSWRFIAPPKWLEVALDRDGSRFRFNGQTWEAIVA